MGRYLALKDATETRFSLFLRRPPNSTRLEMLLEGYIDRSVRDGSDHPKGGRIL
jgi:hypothetical protein